ncbi:type II toxin-antitoxin system VapC family toxin [Nocardia stercoris]|uniref:Type II toxin-antitoxin system VapC family toxin n=1 Tax=Nocardia stercoris TaxID=2483361 RepID=A0A3M2LDK7_9NOCA|nr:type II toxin-antitoxin system VapC family toxin [Nocardia stercoris]RMI35601.1 type II toxin-antitoxin system VapC family toxin [Nocardia stercoris]
MFILDTNVVSELRKARHGRADTNVVAWAADVPAAALFVSAITVHELELGVLQLERKDPTAGAALRHWLDNQVMSAFADRIIDIGPTIARRSAALHVPVTRPFRDSLIAATGLVHSMPVVTRNTADFEHTGVEVINPWLRNG